MKSAFMVSAFLSSLFAIPAQAKAPELEYLKDAYTLAQKNSNGAALVDGVYHTTTDKKYSKRCSVKMEFKDNGKTLILTQVDNQITHIFCEDKSTEVFRCSLQSSSRKMECKNSEHSIPMTILDSKRFVNGTEIIALVNTSVVPASRYLGENAVGWDHPSPKGNCYTDRFSKQCSLVTLEDISKHLCPDAMRTAETNARNLCEGTEEKCKLELTRGEPYIIDDGKSFVCFAYAIYKKSL